MSGPTDDRLPALRPECPNGHGYMELRDGGLSPEAEWCGVWYDCPPGIGHCRSSVLLPSRELVASLGGES